MYDTILHPDISLSSTWASEQHAYPSSRYGDGAAAWLAVGKEKSVVSHESTLDLLDLRPE
ncbi:MAG: hypothetical protein ACR2JC_03825 [Chloroflexota bacterium]|nr:MAG: hypothetical protein DLM70_08895 [Chloroflexota bacterium]